MLKIKKEIFFLSPSWLTRRECEGSKYYFQSIFSIIFEIYFDDRIAENERRVELHGKQNMCTLPYEYFENPTGKSEMFFF